MCREAKSCTWLGEDHTTWSRREPLPIPDWFEGELLIFREAVEHSANGDRVIILAILKGLRAMRCANGFWNISNNPATTVFLKTEGLFT
jgi:hypothetical protein